MGLARTLNAEARSAVAALVTVVCVAATGAGAAPRRSPRPPVPPDVTAGIAVFDRRTGSFSERRNAAARFRAASVVKLLIALDYLWNRGPSYEVPPTGRTRLGAMLSSSDDGAAGHFWDHLGEGEIVTRMAARLGLTGTEKPPRTHPGYWGYTATTADDTVRVYRYVLDSAPAAVRDCVMGGLRRATRRGTDGFDQFFGIPSAFRRPWAVKQGWSGFPSAGCTADTGAPDADESGGGRPGSVDLTRRALHTTGTVGADDRSIVAVFTLHPEGTPYKTACTRLSRLTRSLRVPGGRPPAGT